MQGDSIQLATKALNENSVVGIPTETVYGIGVNPYSEEAVKKLFEIKNIIFTKFTYKFIKIINEDFW